MASFEYGWWTVDIVEEPGPITLEVKAKTRENAIKQIKREVAFTNSEKNAKADFWHRKARILEVKWETLKLDRQGYQRLFKIARHGGHDGKEGGARCTSYTAKKVMRSRRSEP